MPETSPHPALDRLAGAVDMVDQQLAGVPLEAWDGHHRLAEQLAHQLVAAGVELEHASRSFALRAQHQAAQ